MHRVYQGGTKKWYRVYLHVLHGGTNKISRALPSVFHEHKRARGRHDRGKHRRRLVVVSNHEPVGCRHEFEARHGLQEQLLGLFRVVGEKFFHFRLELVPVFLRPSVRGYHRTAAQYGNFRHYYYYYYCLCRKRFWEIAVELRALIKLKCGSSGGRSSLL